MERTLKSRVKVRGSGVNLPGGAHSPVLEEYEDHVEKGFLSWVWIFRLVHPGGRKESSNETLPVGVRAFQTPEKRESGPSVSEQGV